MVFLIRARESSRNQSGSVLVLTLWVLIILMCLAFGISYRSRLHLRLSQYAWDEMKLVQQSKKIACENVSSWSRNTVIENRRQGFQDENSRLNLNTVDAQILQKLFGAHAEVVSSILAWRSPTGSCADYTEAGYRCRRGPFQSVQELRLVQEMTPEIFQEVEPFLTVNTEGEINLNSAPERVLQALGLSDSFATKILALRAGQDGQLGTADDVVYDERSAVVPFLESKMTLSAAERQMVEQLVPTIRFVGHSNAVRFTVTAQLPGNPARLRTSIVATGRPGSIRFLQWEEES